MKYGSPALAACCADESDNKWLKAMAQHSHNMVFHGRVLSTWRQLAEEKPKMAPGKRRRKDPVRPIVSRAHCKKLY